jgi:NAD-dependent DNA ligase
LYQDSGPSDRKKRGDIIPYIEKVVKSAKKPQFPNKEEFGEYDWNSTGVDLVLTNPELNETTAVKRINHFFRTLDVENFSEGLVARFYEHGYDTIEKILSMTKAEMQKNVRYLLLREIPPVVQLKLPETECIRLFYLSEVRFLM